VLELELESTKNKDSAFLHGNAMLSANKCVISLGRASDDGDIDQLSSVVLL